MSKPKPRLIIECADEQQRQDLKELARPYGGYRGLLEQEILARREAIERKRGITRIVRERD